MQNLGSSGTTANFRDIGVGAEGTLTYGAQGKVVSMTPQADGSIVYGAPITASVAVGDNLLADNLPAIAMLCQAAASGDGTKGAKSTDVLVKAQAIRITDAKALANDVARLYPRGWLIQEQLRQPPDIEALIGPGIGTVRLVTLWEAEGPTVLYAVWRHPAPVRTRLWQYQFRYCRHAHRVRAEYPAPLLALQLR